MKQRYVITEKTLGQALQAVSQLPTDGSYKVVIDKAKSRSLAQNALYWKWLRLIATAYADAGGELHSPEIWHEYLGGLFLEVELAQIQGSFMRSTQSTTNLSTKAMAEYMEKVELWAGDELELQLPHPDDPWAN